MTFPSPGPWVDYERPRSAPWTSNEGIIKLIEFPVRAENMSRRAFHLYWMRHHSPHVMNVTPFAQFMRKYCTAHIYPEPLSGLPRHYVQTTPFEGAGEVWINRLEEVGAWLSHPLYGELIQPDEAHFIRQDGSTEVILSTEERIYEPDPDMREHGMTKVYLIVNGRRELGHDALHEALSGYGKALTESAAQRERLRKLVISHRVREPWPEGFPLAAIDAVMELWFARREDVGAFFEERSYRAAAAEHEASCMHIDTIRAVVCKLCVVHDEFSFQPTMMQPQPWDY